LSLHVSNFDIWFKKRGKGVDLPGRDDFEIRGGKPTQDGVPPATGRETVLSNVT